VVRPSEVQGWASERARVLAPSTMRQLVGLLRAAYCSAVADGLVAASPVASVKLPRHERPRLVPLTVEQVHCLSAAMRDRQRALPVPQAGLGLRLGELLALRLSDVDFLRRTVTVTWQLEKATRRLSEPKTPRSRRVVPLPAVVADSLAAHLLAYPVGDGGWIFTGRDGRPYGHDTYSRLFRQAVQRARLPADTTTHDLRHHYASVVLAAGESVVAVAERLGHENATLVLTTYGHLMPDSEDRTRRAIDAAWGSAGPTCEYPATAPPPSTPR